MCVSIPQGPLDGCPRAQPAAHHSAGMGPWRNISAGIRDPVAVLRFMPAVAQSDVFPVGAHRCWCPEEKR